MTVRTNSSSHFGLTNLIENHSGRFVLSDRQHGALAEAARAFGKPIVVAAESVPAADRPAAYSTLTGLLVRPDGVIVWASEDSDATAGLDDAIRRWIAGSGVTRARQHRR